MKGKIAYRLLASAAISLAFLPGCRPPVEESRPETPRPPAAPAPVLPVETEEKESPMVEIETSLGTITCRLFPARAPLAVASFTGLASGSRAWKHPETGLEKTVPLYDGTVFHRVIPGFMIQGGDPAGTGRGGPGYSFEDEFDPALRFDRPGLLAMANSGPDTNGSQFFITVAPTPWLNDRHTIFGEVTAGMETVEKISLVPRDPSDRPVEPVVIRRVRVLE